MFLKVSVYIFSLLVICESAFVDTLFKCSKDDADCQAKLIKKALENMGDGVPEYNLTAIDPFKIENFKLSLLEVDITLIKGVLEGVSKCTVNSLILKIETGDAKLDITCGVLVVKGNYKVFSSNPLIKSVLGGSEVSGNGNGKVKIQNLNLKIDFKFKVVKRGDDIFLAERKGLSFTYDVGIVVFSANNLCLGKTESSETIIKLLNENYKIIMESFGKDVMKVAMNQMRGLMTGFFSNVPAKHYFIDDLTPYVEN